MNVQDYDVLVACEESGMVRDALIAVGVRAMSCDLKLTRRPGPHYQGDVRDILPSRHWRGLIAHPVCKFLANSGAKHLYRRINGVWAKEHGPDPERWAKMADGAGFFRLFLDADHIPLVAVENSIPHGHAVKLMGRSADQYTQPWMFGDPFTKAAGWWLKKLPKLKATHQKSDYDEIHPKCWKMGPSPDREEKRSETEPAIARAIALQWGPHFLAAATAQFAEAAE